MYIERFLEPTLRTYLGKREIIALVGPRQCGKTTLLKHIFKDLDNACFLDFEDRQVLELFENDIEAFIDMYVKKYQYVCIDEFQYAHEGGKKLKYIYDHYKTKIVVSGSSVSELSIQSIKYLVGRIFVFRLYPCSFEEFLKYKNSSLYEVYTKRTPSPVIIKRILPLFHEFCIYGGYPRVLLAEEKEEKERVLQNIYSIYFLREIKEILQLHEDHKLVQLLHALALQIGNIVNYKELSDISGFPYSELLHHLTVLEKTFICMRVRPYYTNKQTELVKAPKIFFLDNGLRNSVIKNFQPIYTRMDKGHLYENFVATELYKEEIELKYWRTKAKAEVDFIVEKNGHLIPIEVKSQKTQMTKSLRSFLEKYKPKKCYVLTLEHWKDTNTIVFRPVFSVQRILT
jgi:uncharacterized protein